MMPVAFKIQHRIHHMLQHPRSGDGAFLRHMSDDEDGDVVALRDPHEFGRAFAHLRHATGCARVVRMNHRLDRVHDDEFRVDPLDRVSDRVDIRFRVDVEVGALDAEPFRPQFDLTRAFLSGDVQDAVTALVDLRRNLQQQGGLADSRVAPDQNQRTGHDAAAQHMVDFFHLRFDTRQVFGLDVLDRDRFRYVPAEIGTLLLLHCFRRFPLFLHLVPSAAVRAASQPFRRLVSASLTNVFHCIFLCQMNLSFKCEPTYLILSQKAYSTYNNTQIPTDLAFLFKPVLTSRNRLCVVMLLLHPGRLSGTGGRCPGRYDHPYG